MKEKKPIGFPIAPLPTIRVGDIEALKNPDGNWLVEALWSSRAVGVLGGPPKCSKTWLACDIALSVASGTKVLGCYSVKEPGPVVFFAAEDPRPLLRERFWGMATHRGLSLKSLEVLFLDVPVLRLDQKEDQEKLSETLRSVRPRLLVLDPLVRLHSLDENSATAISGFLSYLRRLERRYEVAILLVHHTRKHAGVGIQAGQGLRGSSDIHAWGDSNLYLRRAKDGLLLTVEHRSASPPEPISLDLVTEPQLHLQVTSLSADDGSEEAASEDSFLEEVLWHLQSSSTPLRVEDLRSRLHVRKQRIVDALRDLTKFERVERRGDGFVSREPAPED